MLCMPGICVGIDRVECMCGVKIEGEQSCETAGSMTTIPSRRSSEPNLGHINPAQLHSPCGIVIITYLPEALTKVIII